MRRRLLIAAAAVAVWAAPAPASADECNDCKQKCRDEVKKCQNAAPKPLCKVPGVGGVCTMFKHGQCNAAGSVCRQVGCGVGGPCGGGSGPSAGGGQVSGDPHFYSLDRSQFDFQGAGEFLVCRSEAADVELQARFTPRGTRASVMTMLAVKAGEHVVVFEPKQNVAIDGREVKLAEKGVYIHGGLTLALAGHNKYLLVSGTTQLWVHIGQTHLNLYLEPDAQSRSKWQGLLGNFDGDPNNDFQTRDGTVLDRADMTPEILYGTFGESWRLSQDESVLRYREGETTATFTDRSFPKSHYSIAEQPPEAFAAARAVCIAKGVLRGEALRNCIYDVGITDSEEFAETYADAHYVAAAAALRFAGKFSMRAQESGYQGEEIQVYWSAAADNPRILLKDTDGKTVAHASTRRGSPAALRLPAVLGTYTLALTQGDDETSQQIEVTPVTATITAPDTVGGAMEFDISWTGPLGDGDYIALMEAGQTDPRKYIAYRWASRQRSPDFQAPATPGTYEIWYVLQGGGGERSAIGKTTITVTEPTASVTPPASAEVGAFVPVEWTGPAGSGDFVDIVVPTEASMRKHLHYAWVQKDKELRLRAPAMPGNYTIRYVAHTAAGYELLTTAPITITDTKATLKAPATVVAGAELEVSWTGPRRTGDYVSIARPGDDDPRQHVTWKWAKRHDKATMKAPDEPGRYELRYILHAGDGRRILTRRPITVKAR